MTFDDIDAASFARDRAGLAECRAKRLPISLKMYQEFVVRHYLRIRRNRRLAK